MRHRYDFNGVTPARREGIRTFVARGEEGVECCPYPIGDKRRALWFGGFYEARTAHKLGPSFANRFSSGMERVA